MDIFELKIIFKLTKRGWYVAMLKTQENVGMRHSSRINPLPKKPTGY